MPDAERRALRLEDRPLLAGAGGFVADRITPETLHVAFVRSPHARARIDAIDVGAARQTPGVCGVVTAADLPPAARQLPDWTEPSPALRQRVRAEVRPLRQPVLAADRVTYVGQAVAAVVAESREAAEDGAEQIAVAYETLPAVVDPEAALRPGAERVHPEWADNRGVAFSLGKGDPETVCAGAHHCERARFFLARQGAVPMENRGVLAVPGGAAETLRVWSSTQAPYRLRRALSDLLGLPRTRVRVMAPDVGGGFGPKSVPYPEEVVVAWLALATQRPVAWIADRREDMLTMAQSQGQVHKVTLAVEGTGQGPAEQAQVSLAEDGRIICAVSSAPYGQGHRTTFARLCAEALAVPLEQVEIRTGDTDDLPDGSGTYGSRGAVVAGSAVFEAAGAFRRQVLEAARELLEAVVYDATGQNLTASLADYLVPVADLAPADLTSEHLVHPSPHNPLGVKGSGESGSIPVMAAVANAVEDALRPFGARLNEMPLTPERVWLSTR